MTRLVVLALLMLAAPALRAEEDAAFDSVARRGIDRVYNLEFERAEEDFRQLMRMRPAHPAGHFFMAMVDWWRILINLEDERYDERFLSALDAEPSPAAALARLQANVVGSLPEQLRELRPLLSATRVGVRDLPAELSGQMVAPDGRARVEVYPRADLSDSVALERFVDTVRGIAPGASGGAVWMVEWGRVTWHAMARALSIGMVCMIVFLILLWRSVWDTVLAFFPLALAVLVTGAAMALLGAPFNFANVIVLPMLVGMGVDNGVHLVHRHRTRPDEIEVLASSTARAVVVSALTTIMTFGSMAFASHRGIAAIGQLLTLGVFLTLVSYVVVLPAILEWDDRRRRRHALVATAPGSGPNGS